MRIAFCGTIKDDENILLTIDSINHQSVKVDEIITTTEGNIAIGRNSYLKKVKADIIFTYDSGCIYEKDYVKKMLAAFDKDTDIVMGIVFPQTPESLIQEFCSLRIPQYFRFTEQDWDAFIPSNRQVAFRKSVILQLGLLPEYLSRGDDTYWYALTREKKLKFKHCEAKVYWEMKKSLGSYLRTLYQDNLIDKKYNLTPAVAPQKITPLIFPYGLFVSFLAMITKLWTKLK